MKLLITGFQPFGGSPINPSEQVVLALAHDGIAGIELRSVILPAHRVQSGATLIPAPERFPPDALVPRAEAGRGCAAAEETTGTTMLTTDGKMMRGCPRPPVWPRDRSHSVHSASGSAGHANQGRFFR